MLQTFSEVHSSREDVRASAHSTQDAEFKSVLTEFS